MFMYTIRYACVYGSQIECPIHCNFQSLHSMTSDYALNGRFIKTPGHLNNVNNEH